MIKDNPQWSLGKLRRTAASEMQKAIRMEAADDRGFCTCVTCGQAGHFKEMHAGHFVPSRCNAVLFEERGVHPQCVLCNTYLDGNQGAYAAWMLEHYGQEVVDELLQLRNQTRSFTREELVEMRRGFRERIRQQALRLGQSAGV